MACCFAAGVAPACSPASAGERPALLGALAGELRVEVLPGLGLGWDLQATAEGLVLRARRPGLELELVARSAASGTWSWSVRRGAADLAELWPTLRERLGPAAAAWSASGRLEIAGRGSWSPDAGPAGEIRLSLREGWARSDAAEIELAGIEGDLATRDLVGAGLSDGQALRVAKITAGNLVATDLAARFGLDAERVLTVSGLQVAVLGGRVRLRPFSVPLGKPAAEVSAELVDLSLAEAARLAPWALASASGSLQGRVRLAWDETHGLRVRDGGMTIVRRDGAEFRLAPSPGFLTGSMSRRFAVFPRLWGAWTRRVGPLNPAYASLRAIEMGEAGLRIEDMEVAFFPAGREGGPSASVRVLARPIGVELVERLDLEVNVHGPLADALALGLNDRARAVLR